MNMYSQIEEACEKEHTNAKIVFPNPPLVINMLIQRIFKKHVSLFLDSVSSFATHIKTFPSVLPRFKSTFCAFWRGT